MKIQVSPQVDLIDSPLAITGSGFLPNSKVTFVATTNDTFGQEWRSQTTFYADDLGRIDLGKQSPVSGNYQGIDPMGLIYSMTPGPSVQPKSMYLPPNADSIDVTITVKSDAGYSSEITVKRYIKGSGVTTRDVKKEQLVGKLFIPGGSGPHPGILLCTGSEGGIVSQLSTASLLASHGYVVFVMAYFNYEGLHKELYEMPLKQFLAGVNYLRQLVEVDSKHIAAMGPSKGAEGLLAAAAMIPEMKLQGLIAISPSSVVWQGIGRGKPKAKSSWSYQGKALSYVKMSGEKIAFQFMLADILRRFKLDALFPSLLRTTLSPAYSAVKKSSKAVEVATIPVENIASPLLLIAGGRDKVWCSDFMSQTMINRRKTCRHAALDKLFVYPDAGHLFRCPNMPTTISWRAPKGAKMILNFGGSAKANAYAQRDAWTNILAFLDKHLRGFAE